MILLEYFNIFWDEWETRLHGEIMSGECMQKRIKTINTSKTQEISSEKQLFERKRAVAEATMYEYVMWSREDVSWAHCHNSSLCSIQQGIENTKWRINICIMGGGMVQRIRIVLPLFSCLHLNQRLVKMRVCARWSSQAHWIHNI